LLDSKGVVCSSIYPEKKMIPLESIPRLNTQDTYLQKSVIVVGLLESMLEDAPWFHGAKRVLKLEAFPSLAEV
jgi:hypothetical protein